MKQQAVITSLQKKWKALSLASLALVSLAAAVVFITCLHQLFGYSFGWIIPAWLVVWMLLLLTLRSWRIQQQDVILHLNRHIPQLEESSELLLKPPGSLNLLQQMQVNKLKENITHASAAHPVSNKLKRSVLALLLSVIVSMLVFVSLKPAIQLQNKNIFPVAASPTLQQVLPSIAAAAVKIISPVYTGIAPQTQQAMDIVAVEGAGITWQIETNKPVNHIRLIFGDSTSLPLHAVNDAHTIWANEKTISHPGFYQVQIDSSLSDLYKLDMIKDQPPAIIVQSPKPSTVIDFGEPQRATVQVSITDDYGVSDATIMATVASGAGEAVKFSEQAIHFSNSFSAHNKNYALKKTIDLPSLGMKPGDELYLYIKTSDNSRQQTQSDTYIISIADTAELMSFDGIINSINLKPEYFRSQRQIIIETEQLLKDKPSITQDAFNNKSNDLGIDQKLLRLRYGKFLGEEFEANIGEHDAGNNEHDAQKKAADANTNFGNAEVIIDQFSHKHDVAEDATFFDPQTKKQLKAVLTEMWNAELRLRTFKPADALPFEYKALRLLKDLQQQSRVYVAKTNIKTPALKPETRLTGELDKIISPSTQNKPRQKNMSLIAAQQTLSILENIKTNDSISNAEMDLLQQTNQLMMQAASISPGKYLAALRSYQRILNQLQQKQQLVLKDIHTAQQGLQQMLLSPAPKPSALTANGNSLSQQYFMNIKEAEQP